MSFIEGIGDDFLYAFGFLVFIGIVALAWLSTHVNYMHFPARLFIIERRTRRRNEEEAERTSSTPPSRSTPPNEQAASPSSGNETQTEHESDNESSDSDEFTSESTPIATELPTSPKPEQQCSHPNPIDIDHQQQTTTDESENQSFRIIIKFLDDTRKEISVNADDTISKVKQLHFADELATNKMIRFIYQGRELQDRETLRTYNIHDQTIIHCQISARRHESTTHRNNGLPSGPHVNTNRFDTSAFIDPSPVNISSNFVLLLSGILAFIWYLRIKYRVLFSPISTVILIVITIIFAIYACGSFIATRQRIANTRPTTITVTPVQQHAHQE